MEQRSAEWYEIRRGKFTASEFADLMAKPDTAAYKGLLVDKAWEIWSGKSIPSYTNAAMQKGVELEPIAKSWFEFQTGRVVKDVAFLVHPTLPFVGCSPDGELDNDELVEIKCPQHRAHMETVRTKEAPSQYRWQLQGQLWVSGKSRNNFVSYNEDAPRNIIVPIDRDDKAIRELEARAKESWERVQEIVEQLRRT